MAKLPAKITRSIPLVVSIALLTAPVIADERDRDSPWYVTGFGEYYWSDGDKDQIKWDYTKDGPGLGVELGYILNENWDIRAEYSHMWLDSNGVNDTEEVDRFGLDALYFFDDTPYYAVMGAKQFSQHKDWTAVNLGAGYRRAIAENWSLGAEATVYQGVSQSVTDFGLKLGATYFFGSKNTVKATPAPVAEPVVAAAAAPAAVVEKDSDADGVVDTIDVCPNTPSSDQVDAKGCTVFTEEQLVQELDVYFANNSDEITDEYMAEIEKFADFMKRYPNTNVEIGGHTSSVGSDAYNQQLSEKRAQAVAKVLSENFGIDASRLTAVGYGEAMPKYQESAKNRRIEAILTVVEKVRVKK